MKMLTAALAVCGTALMFSTTGFAQQGLYKKNLNSYQSRTAAQSSATTGYGDVYQVTYFRNGNLANYTSQVIDIVDPGTNGAADLWALIYVITPDEELSECCSCPITPDQVIELQVNSDLLANDATGGTVHNGTIKILSSTSSDPGNPTVVPELRAWTVRDYKMAGADFATERPFAAADLSAAELYALSSTCAFFEAHLSGHGICSCGPQLAN